MGIEKKITEMLVTASCGDQKQIAETIAKEMGLVLDGRPITISFKMSIFDEVVDVETAHATIECLVDWINHRFESKNWKHGNYDFYGEGECEKFEIKDRVLRRRKGRRGGKGTAVSLEAIREQDAIYLAEGDM